MADTSEFGLARRASASPEPEARLTALPGGAGADYARRYLRDLRDATIASAPSPGAAGRRDPGPSPEERARFLVVDDKEPIRALMARILGPAGHEVLLAPDAEAALALLETEAVDAVFCDIHMPGMSGFDVLRALAAREGAPDVVLMTGYADVQSVIHALQHGARDFILKPFDANRIRRVAGALASERALRRENLRLRRELERSGESRSRAEEVEALLAERSANRLIEERLGAAANEAQLFEEATRLAAHLTSAETARLWRFEAAEGLLHLGPCRGDARGAPQARDVASDRSGAAACARARAILTGPGGLDAEVGPDAPAGAVERIHAPIARGGELYGVLEVAGKYGGAFSERDRDALALVAERTASFYEPQLILQGMTSAMFDAVGALVRAVGARDHYTFAHSERVAHLSVETARRLGLAEAEIAGLRAGAFLHDVGKIGVPDALLLKPGKLDREEFETVKAHPTIGARIVAPLARMFPGMADVVRGHHERWDGRGYPAGLAGEAIPLTARIVCVVDAYDAMNSDRPYRPALGSAAALAEIERASGSQFDPRVVQAFLDVVRAG